MKKILWLFALMALLAACSASDSTSGNDDQSVAEESSSSVSKNDSDDDDISSESSKDKSSSSSKKAKSSSSAKESKSSSSSVAAKESSSSKGVSSSSEDLSSSSEEAPSSSSIASSSSRFNCQRDYYCASIAEKCDEDMLDSFKIVTKSETRYYHCDTNGWQYLTHAEYDTFGKKCEADGDTLWSNHVFKHEDDSLNTGRTLYICREGKPEQVINYLKHIYFECNEKNQNRVVQKKYSSFICQGNAWSLLDQETGTMVDPRDGKEYRTVGIGNHLWMQEELRYNQNPSTNVTYTWSTAMGGIPAAVKEGAILNTYVQGVCPDGWRVVSHSDLIELSSYFKAMSAWVSNFEQQCYIGKENWSRPGSQYDHYEGTDCMNTMFFPADISVSGTKLKESDKGHLTGMWVSWGREYKGEALLISNARFTGGTTVPFKEYGNYSMSSAFTVRCVKNEDGEYAYKTALQAPTYTVSR